MKARLVEATSLCNFHDDENCGHDHVDLIKIDESR